MKKILSLIAISTFTALTGQAAVVLSDTFSYADGPLVTAGGGWTTSSGTPNQLDVASGIINITSAESEDVTKNFDAAATYSTGVLVATLTVNFSALPTAAGTYFTHFKDATTGFRGRVFAITTGAAAGSFRLAISNSTTTVAAVPLDLSLGTAYTLTISLDVATGASTLSINGGTAVAATDATTPIVASSYAFRQATGEGTLTADNLSVDYTVAAPEPSTLAGLALGTALLIARRRRALRA